MKIKSISLGRTINIGNYESIRIDIAAELQGGDTVEETMKELNELLDKEAEKIAIKE
jgi:hypothetical protein